MTSPNRTGEATTRRGFLRASLAAATAALGCGATPLDQGAGPSRLTARPGTPSRELAPGTHDLARAAGADCTLFVPQGYRPGTAAGLFVMMHGAGNSRNFMHQIFAPAEPYDLLVLVPTSRGRTWDMVLGGFGPDVQSIDRALEYTFDHCTIDPASITLAGFSDGGSYALSLGVDNGDLFTRLVAFSPGFLAPLRRVGQPLVYIVHGTQDTILPIDSTSRRIVRQLREWNYDVTYNEFEGPHTIRLSDARGAFDWITARPGR